MDSIITFEWKPHETTGVVKVCDVKFTYGYYRILGKSEIYDMISRAWPQSLIGSAHNTVWISVVVDWQ